MKKIWNWIRNLFTMRCPVCDGKMKSVFIDMDFDKLVWECDSCKKLWI